LIKQKYFHQEIQDEHWVRALNEELDHIEKNLTWKLVLGLVNRNVIGTKQVSKKKSTENG